MTPQHKLALEVVQFALDLVGVVDPTGAADGLSGLISLGRGKWLDAAISGVSLVPYIGDMAKSAKLPRYVKSVAEAIQWGARDHKFAAMVKPAFEKLLAALDKVPLDKLPASTQSQIRQVKLDIEGFLRRRMYNPNPKHEVAWARGVKRSPLDISADEAYELLNDATRCVEIPLLGLAWRRLRQRVVYLLHPVVDGAGIAARIKAGSRRRDTVAGRDGLSRIGHARTVPDPFAITVTDVFHGRLYFQIVLGSDIICLLQLTATEPVHKRGR